MLIFSCNIEDTVISVILVTLRRCDFCDQNDPNLLLENFSKYFLCKDTLVLDILRKRFNV